MQYGKSIRLSQTKEEIFAKFFSSPLQKNVASHRTASRPRLAAVTAAALALVGGRYGRGNRRCRRVHRYADAYGGVEAGGSQTFVCGDRGHKRVDDDIKVTLESGVGRIGHVNDVSRLQPYV